MLRALCRAQSRPYTGTLTPLKLQRTARKILSCAGIKVGFTKKRKFHAWGFPLSIFISFFLKYRILQYVSNWRSRYGLKQKKRQVYLPRIITERNKVPTAGAPCAQYGLIQKRRGYSRAALLQKGAKLRRVARLAPSLRSSVCRGLRMRSRGGLRLCTFRGRYRG